VAVFPVPLLDGQPPKVSDHYGYSSTRGRLHAGADLMYRRPKTGTPKLPTHSANYFMPDGVPALAFDSGTVSRAGTIGTGGRVEIDHGGGLSTKYYHLRDLRMKAGDRVSAGDVVGTVSHNPSGYKLNHLHFETLKNGQQVNPEPRVFQGKMVNPPQTGTLLKIALAAGLGLLAYKYVF
jgi:murein DD-endopeptidase MepM/ murein hydrolase activator NlpD